MGRSRRSHGAGGKDASTGPDVGNSQNVLLNQGLLISTLPESPNGNASSFHVLYARWLEEHLKQVDELRAAVSAHAGDGDLQAIVHTIMVRWREIFSRKGAAAKADAFGVLSATWTTPVERCFLWLGGFRPSELLKLLASRLEPLTEQQVDSIDALRHSSLQAEEALSKEMEALWQSVTETVAAVGLSPLSYPAGSGDGCTVGNLGALEGLLQQADDLRLRILGETRRVLTTRQCVRAVLVVSDYFSRMHALGSLWMARPSTGVN